jgi:trans-aconitate methyltransferase
MTIRSRIVSQFSRPHGLLGHLAGIIMANRASNIDRNIWTIGLLELEEDHQVLELGCGPGIGLKAGASRLVTGRITGIDHSAAMLKQARRRLNGELKLGKCVLQSGGLDWLTEHRNSFDRIYSANVIQFLPDFEKVFQAILLSLKTGGIVATTYQPRHKNSTRRDALDMSDQIQKAMENSGFAQISHHELPLKPFPAVCVVGKKIVARKCR